MRSNAGMANKEGDVDLREAQVTAPSSHFGLAWLGLAWLGLAWLGLAWLGLAWLGLALLTAARNFWEGESPLALLFPVRRDYFNLKLVHSFF